jgi:hypothetical protein
MSNADQISSVDNLTGKGGHINNQCLAPPAACHIEVFSRMTETVMNVSVDMAQHIGALQQFTDCVRSDMIARVNLVNISKGRRVCD